ncbi:uncharacterized protein LOC129570691 [Sitodiplosis mosellana]|uniref:uncharacterized protein LOC129570691 n=1 Tax=Sitodiplosis mosellana TaxID=263140 RepID=UPI0024438C3B|nr:uncharacterized protein LOC129570691 [Sitodiplosis mosellana]XP_055306366.1 uncharacterized protein LOC129570691 [Sitodiplosis mosellana]
MPEEKKVSKGSREKNYTDFECLELIRAIKKYAHIIECRNLGTYRYKNEDRNAAWEAVCQQFNTKTSQNRTVSGLKMKWKNDKSNIRDYIQYLKTSQSRSGRAPEEIPKPKFMNLIAEIMGVDFPALGPIPDVDELIMDTSVPVATNPVKQEPPVENSDLSFEEIMVNENNDQFNYAADDTSSMDSFHQSTSQNQSFHHPKSPSAHPPPAKRMRLADQASLQFNGIPATINNSSEIQELQIQLLKRQIEVQELMAVELKAKIERTQQLMRMDAVESELRCKEITKRLES